MSARARWSKPLAWGLVAWAFALAVSAYQGNSFLFAVYLVALGNAVSFQWWYACSRCANLACAFNARSPEFFLLLRRRQRYAQPEGAHPIRAARAWGWLAASVLPGLAAAWMWNPIAAVAWAAGAVGLVAMRRAVVCVGCGNACPAALDGRHRGRAGDPASGQGFRKLSSMVG